VVVTVDAMHTQTDTATAQAEKFTETIRGCLPA
jgi:hypothetical protein